MTQEQFSAYLALRELSDHTIRSYRAMMLRWCDYAIGHDRDPWRPDPLTARAWASQLPGTASTRAHARSTIKHLCAALEVDDVSAAIPLPRQPKRQPRGLEHDQAVKLATAAHDSGLKGLAVMVGLFTAARRSEIASLCWRRIDLDARTVTLDRPKTRDLHTVPLHPTLGRLLADRRVPGEVWVFPGRYGGHVAPAVIWEWVREVSEVAGIGKVTPHQLRHTALTEANDRTQNLRAVQDLAGHTNPAVTARYTRSTREAMERVVESLDYEDHDGEDADDAA